MRKEKNNSQGFTLIELLIVVAIIAILAMIVFGSLNFQGRFHALSDARNTKRKQDVGNIAQAVELYQIDNLGRFPPGIDNKWRMIGTTKTGCGAICVFGKEQISLQDSCLDLTPFLVKSHLLAIPFDMTFGNPEKTQYAIRKQSTEETVEIVACGAEGETEISAGK